MRSPRDNRPPHAGRPLHLALAVVSGLSLAVALVALKGGSSPVIWNDTYYDEQSVDACLREGRCTLVGIGTSIAGTVHAAGWLQFRSFLEWVGFDLDGTHALMLLSFVLSFGMSIYVAGKTLGGRGAWYTGALLFGSYWFVHVPRLDVLHNSSPVPFLGSVLLVSAFAAVRRPTTCSFVVLGLVVAIAANVHSACGTSALSIVWLAMLAPAHRRWLACVGVAAAVVASFLMAPAGWVLDVAYAFDRGASHAAPGGHVVAGGLLVVAALVVAATMHERSLRGRAVETRDVLVALLVPVLVPFVAMAACGVTDTETKYVVHVHGAMAMAVAAAVQSWSEDVVVRRRSTMLRRAVFGTCAALVVLQFFVRDLVLPALAIVEKPWATTALRRDAASVLVLLVPTSAVPPSQPSSWSIHPSGSGAVLLMATLPSWFDWSSIEICRAESPATCSRVAGDYSMIGELPDRGPVAAHVRWTAPPGTVETLVMPKTSHGCAGRIADVPRGSAIQADGARARLVAQPGDAEPRIVTFVWTIGGDECRSHDTLTFPFLAAGSAETVAQVEPLLERASW